MGRGLGALPTIVRLKWRVPQSRWLFLKEKATRLLRFRSIAIGEPLYPGETIDALWNLVWGGLITNDSLVPFRPARHGPAPPPSPRKVEWDYGI
jgi:hypothetical protein